MCRNTCENADTAQCQCISPFVGVTLAMVENNPAIRLLFVTISSVSVRRPYLEAGMEGMRRDGERRGIGASPPGTRLRRCVRSWWDVPAGGCLRTAGVPGARLIQGLRFAPTPHRKEHS